MFLFKILLKILFVYARKEKKNCEYEGAGGEEGQVGVLCLSGFVIIYDFSCLFCKCPRREKTNEHLFEIDTGSIKGQKILFWILRRDKIRLS